MKCVDAVNVTVTVTLAALKMIQIMNAAIGTALLQAARVVMNRKNNLRAADVTQVIT